MAEETDDFSGTVSSGQYIASLDEQEVGLRPSNLNSFIGHQSLKDNLRVFIRSAQKRARPLDHVLLSGPPGLGKTTLASVISNEMNANLKSTSGPVIEKQGDLAALLTNLEPGQILFIDEIHRVNRSVEEILYTAMEDFKLDLILGQGPGARSVRVDLPSFTLIGATTRSGLLSSPLRDRFGISQRLDFYTAQELSIIVTRSAAILECDILDDACRIIGQRARGTPRIANRLLKRARDFADLESGGVITPEIALRTLEKLEVDAFGLEKLDRAIILALHQTYGGKPVGLDTIAARLAEDRRTIEEVCEPYLLQLGFIQRTHRGRILTDKGIEFARSILK